MGVGRLRCPRFAGKGLPMDDEKSTAEDFGKATANDKALMAAAFELLRKMAGRYVPPQDVYTVGEAATLLHVSPDRLRSFARRDNDPFPIRRFLNGARGSFVLREELLDWLVENTVSAAEEARERRRRKYDK